MCAIHIYVLICYAIISESEGEDEEEKEGWGVYPRWVLHTGKEVIAVSAHPNSLTRRWITAVISKLFLSSSNVRSVVTSHIAQHG